MKRKMLSYSRVALPVLAILALTVISLNVGGAYLRAAEATDVHGVIGLTKNNPGIRRAIEVQGRHTERVMGISGVVGHGVGMSSDGKPVIKIFVTRAGIPGIPAALEGVPTKAEVTGMVVAYVDPTERFDRPVPIGVSTGHPDITAGTIGCRVIDAYGNVYALSNNHIYANENDASLLDSALQPGPYDGDKDPEDAIGTLDNYKPISFSGGDNTIDAAIALSSVAELTTSTPSDGYGTPSSTTKAAEVNLAVQKYGRTTGWTHGQISETNVTLNVCYQTRGPFRCVKLARFVDQIAITPGTFSAGGDSGSLIVTDDENKNPVGLLFAGSSTRTFANPIGAVLTRFGVSVDDNSTSSSDTFSPIADFSFTSSDLTVNFTDLSSDSDGSVIAWDWDFGAINGTSTKQNPTHTYAAGGTYKVTLTVTDDSTATNSVSKDVTVSESGDGITLSATGYKVRGRHHADLEWSGATSTDVEIYRDGELITTTSTPNDGFYTDNTNNVGGGSYVYQVCEEGSSVCSNEATVTF